MTLFAVFFFCWVLVVLAVYGLIAALIFHSAQAIKHKVDRDDIS
jgi:hypothetical protein